MCTNFLLPWNASGVATVGRSDPVPRHWFTEEKGGKCKLMKFYCPGPLTSLEGKTWVSRNTSSKLNPKMSSSVILWKIFRVVWGIKTAAQNSGGEHTDLPRKENYRDKKNQVKPNPCPPKNTGGPDPAYPNRRMLSRQRSACLHRLLASARGVLTGKPGITVLPQRQRWLHTSNIVTPP